MSGGYDILAVAPLIGSTTLNTVARMGVGERTLVSTREQLDRLPDNALVEWSRVCMLSDAALHESEDQDAGRSSGLHAKFIAVEHRGGGSAGNGASPNRNDPCCAGRVSDGLKVRIFAEVQRPASYKMLRWAPGVRRVKPLARLLRSAPALRVTRRNPRRNGLSMAGRQLPAKAAR